MLYLYHLPRSDLLNIYVLFSPYVFCLEKGSANDNGRNLACFVFLCTYIYIYIYIYNHFGFFYFIFHFLNFFSLLNSFIQALLLLFSDWAVSDSFQPHGACQASLSFTISRMEFTQVHVHWMDDAIQPSHPLLPSSPFAFNLSQHQSFSAWWLFPSSGQSIQASASAAVPAMSSQGLFPLGLTDLISLLSKGLSRVLSSLTTIWKHQFFSVSLLYGPSLTWHDYWKNHSCDYIDLCQQNDVFAF